MQSMLKHQHKMFTDIINITKEIIEQQILIKNRTESLQAENVELQVKSQELQQVLATSQEQLQIETTIPIELINQLASVVKHMKEEQQARFTQLLLSLEEAHGQFEKQEHILEENIVENCNNKEKKEQSNGVEAWAKNNGSISRADSGTSSLSNHLTILDTRDENGIESPNSDDPASQSEVITGKESVAENDDTATKENTMEGAITIDRMYTLIPDARRDIISSMSEDHQHDYSDAGGAPCCISLDEI